MAGKILIVDDVATSRIVLKARLGRAFYRMIQASDGVTGLAQAATEPLDLVLVAARLPDMTGADFCGRVRADPATAALPVIVLGAAGAEGLAALMAGADDVMALPLDEALLLARVRSLMRAREAEDELMARGETCRDLGFTEPEEDAAGAPRIGLIAADAGAGVRLRRALTRQIDGRIEVLGRGEALGEPSGGVAPEAFVLAAAPPGPGASPETCRDRVDAVLDLMSELRSRSATRHAAILVLLPGADTAAAARALDLGAGDVVTGDLMTGDQLTGDQLTGDRDSAEIDGRGVQGTVGGASARRPTPAGTGDLLIVETAGTGTMADMPPAAAIPPAAPAVGAQVREGSGLGREIGLRLARLIARKRRNDRLRESVAAGLQLAVTDPLTGLYNRRYALPHLARIAERARISGKRFSVMVLDLDRFKAVNDTFGHAAGDAVLVSVAHMLARSLRPGDLLARIGGEEFLVALPDADLQTARRLAERLCKLVGANPVTLASGTQITVTLSIGLAVGDPSSRAAPLDALAVIDRADRALLGAKSEGRNQVTVDRPAA
ncbi:diguanylate cyclase [Acidimangrovimonas sediminis]|uniref:diguanylate cyclase n=1 Tax=Acidimangrovimonas sediminis TaxID=2056283 RepID=UPI00130480A0|nr:diguanylate cyclase [Acidimangrovimonas sediminis]